MTSPPRSASTRSPDFYSASGARDLVLHVQEHRFTIAQLGQAIGALGLELLGFEFADPSVRARYRERFPQDPAAASLENWARFEADHPALFGRTYPFWVLKPAE